MESSLIAESTAIEDLIATTSMDLMESAMEAARMAAFMAA
jgi:hypothetical protein